MAPLCAYYINEYELQEIFRSSLNLRYMKNQRKSLNEKMNANDLMVRMS